jgi:ubiquinone biosynthesis protein COQ9
MDDERLSEEDHLAETRARVLAAALPNVAFDGWTERTLRTAVADSGVDAGLARLAFPRGAVDLALHFHDDGDWRLREELEGAPLADMRIRERIAYAVRRRLELAARDREAVRRGATLFALPPYAAEGARAVWRTADTIWTALGDTSEDSNWYTKRAILAGVYSSTALYWLGDASDGFRDTWAFLDRRIEGVMQFEKFKAAVNNNPLGKLLMTGPNMVSKMVRAPKRA